MPLPRPALDNRRFDQLVAETRALLSRAQPGWTDHNASDPGITLLELFAWLGEQNLYRLDRISDEARRAFVRLAGIEPRAPGVAQTVVAIQAAGAAIDLPARVQLGAGEAAWFETKRALTVSPARLAQLVAGGVDVSTAHARGEAFAAFGERPRAGHTLLLAFDREIAAPGAAVSLHAWSPQWQDDAATQAALIAEQAACGPAIDWRCHYRVRTVWEYWSSTGAWRELSGVVDETRALTLTGFVRFRAPVDAAASGVEARYRIRCRIVGGRFECPPRLAHVATNAVACEHALSRAPRELGLARGHAGAVFSVGEAQVIAGSMRLALEDSAGLFAQDWLEVADWDRAGAHDRVFRLDAEQGLVQSGDGLRGQILPAGCRLRAAYRLGGGSVGNLGAGTLTSVPANDVNRALAPQLSGLPAPLVVDQPFVAVGGSEREPIEQAQARAYDAVSQVDKAVTLLDIERLALATPGVPVARARAIAGRDPLLPCYPAPGCLTLVVIPHGPPPAPRPSQALLDAVARYVGARRLVTSEIRTLAPRYRRVGVQAVLHLADAADPGRVLQQAQARIDAYLDPISGGADGQGWPFGRAVYRTDMLALLAATSGVARVTELGFLVGPGAGAGPGPICNSVELCADELVRPGRHRLRTAGDHVHDLQRSKPHECEPD